MAEKKIKTKSNKLKSKYEQEFNSVKDLLDPDLKDLFDRKPEVALLAQLIKNQKPK